MVRNAIRRLHRLSNVSFVRGVATFQVGSVVMLGVGFASSILYARLLGVHEYGLYAIVTAFAGLVGIAASYGQETTLATFLSEAVGKKDGEKATLVLRYFAQATGLSLAAYAILVLGAPYLTLLFGHEERIAYLTRLVLMNSALQWPSALLFVALQLQRRYALIAILENGVDILQVALATLFLWWGWDIEGLLSATLAVTVATVPVFLLLYERSATAQGLPTLGAIADHVFRRDTGALFRQGWWIALDQQIGKNLYPNLFFTILGNTASLHTVGIFRLGFRLATLPGSLIMPSVTRMTTFSIPRLAGTDVQTFIAACAKVLLGTVGLSAGATVGAAIFVPPLLTTVYGVEYADAVYPFLALLPINVIAATHAISVPLLRLRRKVWLISITNGIGITLAIGLYSLLRESIPSPMAAMSAAMLVYHVFSLTLFRELYAMHRRIKR